MRGGSPCCRPGHGSTSLGVVPAASERYCQRPRRENASPPDPPGLAVGQRRPGTRAGRAPASAPADGRPPGQHRESEGPSLRCTTATPARITSAARRSDRPRPLSARPLSTRAGPAPTAGDALRSAAAAFAVPAALGVPQPLPAVPADATAPGLGHGRLLVPEPGRLGEGRPERPHSGQDPGSVVALLGRGHAVQLRKELLALAPAVLRRQGQGGGADHQAGPPGGLAAWPVPRDPRPAVMAPPRRVAARRAERWRHRRGPGRPGPAPGHRR